MPITTADWLAYVDSLGPTDGESMRVRLESAGVDSKRAIWLVSITRRRQITAYSPLLAIIMAIVGLAWATYQWWLAMTGVWFDHVLVPMLLVFTAGFILVIGSAANWSYPLDLMAFSAIPRELHPPPRELRMAGRASAAARRLLGEALILCFPLVISPALVRDRVGLRDHGVETVGRITSRYMTLDRHGTSYYSRYAFQQGSGHMRLSRERYDEVHVGDMVPVTYLPSRPDINLPVRKSDLQGQFGILTRDFWELCVLFSGIGLGRWIMMRSDLAQQRRIAERGVAVIGWITRVQPRAIQYRFGDQSGRFFWGRRKVRERPAVGQPLVVLYDREKPKRSVPLGAMQDVPFV